MTLSSRDRRELDRIERQLVHDDPELTALFAPDSEHPRAGTHVRQRTALCWAIGLQLLAAVICMNTDSLLLVLTMLGVVVASVIPLARARA